MCRRRKSASLSAGDGGYAAFIIRKVFLVIADYLGIC